MWTIENEPGPRARSWATWLAPAARLANLELRGSIAALPPLASLRHVRFVEPTNALPPPAGLAALGHARDVVVVAHTTHAAAFTAWTGLLASLTGVTNLQITARDTFRAANTADALRPLRALRSFTWTNPGRSYGERVGAFDLQPLGTLSHLKKVELSVFSSLSLDAAAPAVGLFGQLRALVARNVDAPLPIFTDGMAPCLTRLLLSGEGIYCSGPSLDLGHLAHWRGRGALAVLALEDFRLSARFARGAPPLDDGEAMAAVVAAADATAEAVGVAQRAADALSEVEDRTREPRSVMFHAQIKLKVAEERLRYPVGGGGRMDELQAAVQAATALVDAARPADADAWVALKAAQEASKVATAAAEAAQTRCDELYAVVVAATLPRALPSLVAFHQHGCSYGRFPAAAAATLQRGLTGCARRVCLKERSTRCSGGLWVRGATE